MDLNELQSLGIRELTELAIKFDIEGGVASMTVESIVTSTAIKGIVATAANKGVIATGSIERLCISALISEAGYCHFTGCGVL